MKASRVVPLILFGVGNVGRALVRQVIATRSLHASRLGLRLEFVALCDRSGAVVEPRGLADDLLHSLLAAKGAGTPLQDVPAGHRQTDLVSILDAAARGGAIVIDCTASDATVPALLAALEKGYGVVLANKRPLTGPLETYQRLTASPRLRYEATVGAGLPVIGTLRSLLDTGDQVTAIEGAFSGTLGYLCSQLQKGVSYSTAVRAAHRLGYTEPDPRDDLSGMDVARKALILARMLGWPLELSDVHVETLYPAALAGLSVAQFLESIAMLDAPYAMRVQAAQVQGEVLRYQAEVREGRCRVGMESVPLDSPLGRLQGTDNLIVFHTARYAASPLVVQGPGAGAEVTAAGILADVLAVAMTA